MVIQENLLLQRVQPDGQGGIQLLYKVNQYGISAISRPQEEIFMIHWEVDVIKYHDQSNIAFEPCHTTELASRPLRFNNDKSLNEFLEKAFKYFAELETLEQLLPESRETARKSEIGR
jgi:hypothetical protein